MRRAAAARHRPDLGLRPPGAAARPRLDQPEQSARFGLRLRRLRRRRRRAQRPCHGPDPQRSARPRTAGRNGAWSCRRRRSSSAAMHNTCNDSVTFYDLDCLPAIPPHGIRGRSRADRGGLRPQRPRALPAVHVGAADAVLRRRPAARRGPRRRPGPGPARNGATPPTPSASSAGANGRAACSWTAGPFSPPTTRPRTMPKAPS